MGLSGWNCGACSYYHHFQATRCSMCNSLRVTRQQMRDFPTRKYVKPSDNQQSQPTTSNTTNTVDHSNNDHTAPLHSSSNTTTTRHTHHSTNENSTGKENPPATTSTNSINNTSTAHKGQASNSFLKPKSNNSNNNTSLRNPYVRQNPYAKPNGTTNGINNTTHRPPSSAVAPPQGQRTQNTIRSKQQSSLQKNPYPSKQKNHNHTNTSSHQNATSRKNNSVTHTDTTTNNDDAWPCATPGTISQPFMAETTTIQSNRNQTNAWQPPSDIPIDKWTMQAATGSSAAQKNTTSTAINCRPTSSSSSNHPAQSARGSSNNDNNQSVQQKQKNNATDPFTIAATNKKRMIPATYRPGPVPLASETASEWVYPIHPDFPPRDYQLKISNTALFHNTLVSLPTGLGKTFIAAVVLYNYYHWFPTGKVVFLAPTLPLVSQQVEACYKIMGIPEEHTAVMTSKAQASDRVHLWKERRAFFCTPQTVQKDIDCGRCDASQIVCIVLDEAHKATGDYAYTMVVEQAEKAGAKFRIVGLSATPGPNIKAINQVVQTLRCSRVEARSEDDPNVKQYIHSRQTEYIFVKQVSAINTIERHLNNIIGPLLDKIRDRGGLGRIRGNATVTGYSVMIGHKEFVKRTGIKDLDGYFYAAQSFAQIRSDIRQHGIGVAKQKLLGLVNNPKGYTAKIVRGEEFQELWQLVRNATSNPDNSQDSATDPKLNNPKLMKLDEILTEHFKRKEACGESSRAIVFSQWRDSVNEIVSVLMPAQPLIRPRHFVGQGKATGGENTKGDNGTKKNLKAGMKQSEQQEVIREFKSGTYNVLVCTSIGEEGLDIGEVDLIVNFDSLRSPIRMIQRVGRTGRKRDGRVVCLISEGAEERTMKQSKNAERTLQRALKKPSNFKLQKSEPMFPGEPTLVERDISSQKPFQMSQVGGIARSERRSENPKKKVNPEESCTWKLTEEQEKNREALFGTINCCPRPEGSEVSSNPFPEDLRKILLRAQARRSVGARYQNTENSGISRSILFHMEQAYSSYNFDGKPKAILPRDSRMRRRTFRHLSRKEVFETLFPIERVPDLCDDVDILERSVTQVNNKDGYEPDTESKGDESCAGRFTKDNHDGNNLPGDGVEILTKNIELDAFVSNLNDKLDSKNGNTSVPTEITVTHPMENQTVQEVTTSEFHLPTPPESSASSSSEESSDDEQNDALNLKEDTKVYSKQDGNHILASAPSPQSIGSATKVEMPPKVGENRENIGIEVLNVEARAREAKMGNHLVEAEVDTSVKDQSQVLCLPTQESSSSEDESSVDDEDTESENECPPAVSADAAYRESTILQDETCADKTLLDMEKEKKVVIKPTTDTLIAHPGQSEKLLSSCNVLHLETGSPPTVSSRSVDRDALSTRKLSSSGSQSTWKEENSPQDFMPRNMKRQMKVVLSQGPMSCAAETHSNTCDFLTDTPTQDGTNVKSSTFTGTPAKKYLDGSFETHSCRKTRCIESDRMPSATPLTNAFGKTMQISDLVRVSKSCVDLSDTPMTNIVERKHEQQTSEPSATQVLVDTPLTASQRSSQLNSSNLGTQRIEDDIVCAICFSSESPDNDPLLLCDGPGKSCTCDLVVHQGCYGIKSCIDNNDSWRCDPCKAIFKAQTSAFVDRESLTCEICAKAGGPLWLAEATGDNPGWVHPTCKQWSTSSSNKLFLCEFCGASGASNCSVQGCTSVAHPHCAASAGSMEKSWILVQISEKNPTSNRSLQYCSNHRSHASMLLKSDVISHHRIRSNSKRVFFPSAAPAMGQPTEQPARKRLKKKTHFSVIREAKSAEDKELNGLEYQNNVTSYLVDERETKRQRIEKKLKERARCKFIAYEAEIDSQEDIIGDYDEEIEIRRMEEEQSDDSFINDSSQLGYTQDHLDRLGVDKTQHDFSNNELNTVHRSVDFEKARKNEFATPILNRRMNRSNEDAGWGDETPISAPSSEKGLGNMHFIRSVIEHHRNGGDADAIEETYHQIEEGFVDNKTHLSCEGQENSPKTLESVQIFGSLSNSTHNSEAIVTNESRSKVQDRLTQEQKAMIEIKRQEALRRRQERLRKY